MLSIRNPQLRYIVRGTKGVLTKYGLDPQEGQIKAGMKIGQPEMGMESEDLYGTLETLGSNGEIVSKR